MKKLRAYLELTGMTQTELARRMNVSQPTVWAWLNGKGMPNVPNIRLLSEVTGISVEDLIEGDEGEAAA